MQDKASLYFFPFFLFLFFFPKNDLLLCIYLYSSFYMCRAQGDSGHSFVVPSDTFWKLSPSFQPLSYSASPPACLDTLKLLCVWTGETELLFRSYLQGSDIRQLFPRKLTLHIKRERGKKIKKTGAVCLRQKGRGEEKRTRELPKKNQNSSLYFPP